ncbi:MAG: hypothetical protein CVV64_07215 [Candidatus Wallbacteria bacterium HGW-Wallbacteria-1]|uniref:TOG domain-containing protein n=1 Tax=Candidatus Wallbacteria bacterium HGW-Wallbacteria-1 TaxID=2013854 RepID=A0A2N1PT77_9BACT|nr:MAG: hypothetical protein CVV64_07215 [Candidatus Wallbacteria bacterium HGW-Wallbacteria-1]
MDRDHFIRLLKSDDKEERIQAAAGLAGYPEQPSINALLASLEDSHWPVRRQAALSLSQIGKPCLDMLLAVVHTPHENARYWAKVVLGRIADDDVVECLVEMFENASKEGARWAMEALLEIGSRAVQSIIEAAASSKRDMRYWASKTLGKLKSPKAFDILVALLEDPNWAIRLNAVEALGELGDRRGVSNLVRMLSDDYWSIRCQAAVSIGKLENSPEHPTISELELGGFRSRKGMDDDVVRSLVSMLDDSNPEVRISAIRVLGEVGDESMVPVLASRLTDEDRSVQRVIINALGQTGSPSAIPVLESYLNSSAADQRRLTLGALSRINDRAVVRLMTQLLRDQDDEVRILAAKALSETDDHSPLDQLMESLGDHNEYVRFWSARALGRFSESRSLDALVHLLRDPSLPVRKTAVSSLARIGDSAVSASLISAYSAESSREVRTEIITALGDLGDMESIPFLVSVMESGNRELSFFAVRALAATGSSEATAPLLKIAREGSLDERYWSIRALSSMADAGSSQVCDVLMNAVMDEDESIRYSAICSLEETNAMVSADKLIAATTGADSRFIAKAVQVVSRLNDPGVMDFFVTLLEHDDRDVRFNAVVAIGNRRLSSTIHHLVKALSDTYWPVRKSASEALGKIGEQAVDSLLNAMDDNNPDLYYWAVKALGEIRSPRTISALTRAFETMKYPALSRLGAEALGRIGTPEATEPLLKALQSSDPELRFSAAKALRETNDVRAMDSLLRILDQDEGDIRFWAAKALGSIGDRRALEALRRAVEDESQWLRKYAAEAIGVIEKRMERNELSQA